MPFGDRTGPYGFGPRTGRGFGFCSGFDLPGFLARTFRGGWSGFGRGCRGFFSCFGRGRGWRNLFWSTGLPGWARSGYSDVIKSEGEESFLKKEAEFLKQQLEWVENRLNSLKKKQEQTNE